MPQGGPIMLKWSYNLSSDHFLYTNEKTKNSHKHTKVTQLVLPEFEVVVSYCTIPLSADSGRDFMAERKGLGLWHGSPSIGDSLKFGAYVSRNIDKSFGFYGASTSISIGEV